MPFVPLFDFEDCRILTEAGEILVTEANEELLLEFCSFPVTGVQANGAVGDVEVNAEASVRRRHRRGGVTAKAFGVFARGAVSPVGAWGGALTEAIALQIARGEITPCKVTAGATAKASWEMPLAVGGVSAPANVRGAARTCIGGVSVSPDLDDFEALLVLLMDQQREH